MTQMHLRHPRFTYSACGTFAKNKERIKKVKETGDSRYIYQSQLVKACFQHDMGYGDFKDLTRRTAVDKVLLNKAFNIAKNPNYDESQRELALMVYNFCDKKASGGTVKNENISNKELAKELHKLVIRKSGKRKVLSPFIDNIWCADLADMQLISKFNKGFRFLLFFIDIYSNYAWVILLKDKKGIIIFNAFQKILDESKHKPNKIWVDKSSEFCNR